MNRGENSSPMDDCSSFLPYPQRFMLLQQANMVEGITKNAARDFARYFNELTDNQKKIFESIKLGIFDLAKK